MEAPPEVTFRNNHDKTFSILLHPHPDDLLEKTLILQNLYHKKNNITVVGTESTITFTGPIEPLKKIANDLHTIFCSPYINETQLAELLAQMSKHYLPSPAPSHKPGSRKGNPSITALASSIGEVFSTRKKKNRHSDPEKQESKSDNLEDGITPRTRERASSMSSISPERFK